MDKKEIITKSADQTRKLGLEMAKKILNGAQKERIICLSGDLGAGKTTFTQGFLEGLGAQGPFVSPTFMIMKEYQIKFPISNFQFPNKFQLNNLKKEKNNKIVKPKFVYHIDAYRIEKEDMLELGWEEMISEADNVIIVEWAERIRDIVPVGAIWMEFEWKNEKERVVRLKT